MKPLVNIFINVWEGGEVGASHGSFEGAMKARNHMDRRECVLHLQYNPNTGQAGCFVNDKIYNEDDGSLDEEIKRLAGECPGFDWKSDDWGGIFAQTFSNAKYFSQEEIAEKFNMAVQAWSEVLPRPSVKQVDYEYRLRYHKGGAHYHCRLFSRQKGYDTWAGCGNFVLCEEEWVSFIQTFAKLEVLEDGA